MKLTITDIRPATWYAGMLQDSFAGDGWEATCNSGLYRQRMNSVGVTIKGRQFRRGFALASMPVDWTPKVGDVIEVHPSQC